jgi:hypothetical protein
MTTAIRRAFSEHNGNRSGCRLGGEGRRGVSGRGDHRDLAANEIGRELWQSIILTLGPAVFDRHVLALDIADLLQALTKIRALGDGVDSLVQALVLFFEGRDTHVRPEAFRRDDKGVTFLLKPGQLLLVRLSVVL